jgi:hypothetical protein
MKVSNAGLVRHAPGPQSLETKIGLYWLHKLGVGSLVFGIVFLITYSFHLLGPAFKLLIGLAVSALLIVFGERMARKETERWFGHGLMAGGWSLAYFATYAAHYLPDVRIVSSLFLETILLMAVAGGSLVSALRARSEIMSMVSITLAIASILLSGPSALSDLSILIIAATCSVLGNLQNWKRLFATGLAACYIGHFSCHYFHCFVGSRAIAVHDQTIASFFLGLIWLVFTAGIGYSIRTSDESDQNGRIAAMLSYLNAAAFAIGLLFFNGEEMRRTTEILLSSAGAVYLGIGRWLIRRDDERRSTVHAMIGLSFINGAKAMHFSGLTLIILDVIQIVLLGAIGLRYNVKSFRLFAVFLSFLFFPIWICDALSDINDVAFGFNAFEYVKVGVLAAGVMASLAWAHVHDSSKWSDFGFDEKSYADFYYFAANAMTSLLILAMVDRNWQLLALTVQVVVNSVLAVKLRDDLYGVINSLYFSANVFFLLISMASWNTLPIACVIALCYGAYVYSDLNRSEGSFEITPEHLGPPHDGHAHLANFALTWLLIQKLPSEFVTIGLGDEGLTLLFVGLLLSNRLFRLWGLVVLALLTGRLLFYDMPNYNTFERIVSFVVAGLIFLLSSYAYAKFTRAFEDEDPSSNLDLSQSPEPER